MNYDTDHEEEIEYSEEKEEKMRVKILNYQEIYLQIKKNSLNT